MYTTLTLPITGYVGKLNKLCVSYYATRTRSTFELMAKKLFFGNNENGEKLHE